MDTTFDDSKLTFNYLIEIMADAVIVINHPDGVIVRMNKQAETLFGYLSDELMGKPVETLIPTSLKELHANYRDSYYRQPRSRPMGTPLVLHAMSKDGRLIPVDISLTPLNTADGLYVIAMARDISNITHAYDETLMGWSRAMDFRDKETENHTLRVTQKAIHLARLLGMTETQITHLFRGALIHDIGKMGVPDNILLKPGKLTDEEWSIMRKHPEYAYEMLYPIEFLRPALDIPYCHHEKWDGTGYPRGLKGEEIPLAARIFAVVDVWDALSYDRPYRKAWTQEKVIEYIREQIGAHFDPMVVKVFLQALSEDEQEAG